MQYQDIDWNAMWLEARRKRSWRAKKSSVWDRRAESFARRNMTSLYVDRFIEYIKPHKEMTVLDVGSGPGTLAIPLARKVKQVTALDFSSRMLEVLQEQAERAQLRNITTILGAWEDDWQQLGMQPHDVVIASRSMSVDDLEGALKKLMAWGKTVFIGDRVGAGPFDPELFKAVGRDFEPGPDYIFTVNILYRMGIQAQVRFITVDQPKTFNAKQEAIDSCSWMFENLTDTEQLKLQEHIFSRLRKTSRNTWELVKKNPTRWAIISWTTE